MTGMWLRLDPAELIQALETPQDCDAVMKAAALRKSSLLGETSAPIPLAIPAPYCAVQHTDGGLCTRLQGHDGDHASRGLHKRWAQAGAAR